MGNKRLGTQTVQLGTPPVILGTAAIVGSKEGDGPLKDYFDMVVSDSMWGKDSWEKAESKFQMETVKRALTNTGLKPYDMDYVLGGDLLNQCCGTSYGIRELQIPFLGLYGACSTMALTLSVGAMLIDGGFADKLAAVTSSHFCSAERQFRFPLEYGGQRPPTAQWTVTGSGCAILGAAGSGPRVEQVTNGKIVDMGITDANNMGAAMAPAAADTLAAHFKDTNKQPSDYDLILTGDLGSVGSSILMDMMAEKGYDISKNHNDCGLMMFDLERQDVHAGGSGCGCSAATLCGCIYQQLQKGALHRVLFAATGALMSTTLVQQGESIPGIAHAVCITA